ncbi:MAG: glycosyltransferase family 2 protein [bacterium]|nr:glycosyltransferase family 2 protein [bacterium]
MENNKFKIYIGFITYNKNTAKYLQYFLPSLKNQTYKDYKIIAIDNSLEENNDNKIYLEKNYPEIELKWQSGQNLGFAKAYNLMISQAVRAGAEYFLALNSDMILESNVLEKLVNELDNNKELGSATAKTLKWDFVKQEKTNIIDSCGIKLLPGLRFVDYREGMEDNENKDNKNYESEIIGPSGGSAIYRLSALEKVKFDKQYFDELMFMYKEDCDLAYRLFLSGFKSKCVVDAVIYHDRSSSGKGEDNLTVMLNRKNKSKLIKQLSFLNQQIIFIKYWRLQSFKNKIAIIWFEFKMLVFILLFEKHLFEQFMNLGRIKNKIIRY